ncbi:MAG TPA: DUF4221 family protein [Saprospiraceae bacterium]|nr:DUF4221 family protein [Saprospiraceae bacterium]
MADSLVIYLDHETPNQFTSSQILKVGDKPHLVNTFFHFNFIKFYDLSTGQCTKTIRIDEEGPDKLRNLDGGTYFIDSTQFFAIGSLKSIYYVKNTDKLYIKEIIEQVKYRNPNYLPVIYNDFHPVISMGNHKFFLTNSFQFRKGGFAFNIIDTSTLTLTQKVILPDAFLDGFYGPEDFREWNFIFDPKRQILVANFPNIETLYVYDMNFQSLGKYYAESSIKNSPFKWIIRNNDSEEDAVEEIRSLSPKELHNRIKSNWVYYALLFDEKHDLYYRIVGLPISQNDLESEDPVKSRIRNYSIMVMDSEFKLIKEWAIPYNTYGIENLCLVQYDGYLYLQRKIEEEDIVIFDKFNLAEI